MKNIKKIRATISALLICVTALAGCGSEPVQDDLINYINNQLPRISLIYIPVTRLFRNTTIMEQQMMKVAM